MKIITISREFGTGGREIAMRLSEELGVAYYDREILTGISEKLALDRDYVKRVLNKEIGANAMMHFARSFSLGYHTDDMAMRLLNEQYKIVRELAKKGDCIIVGRSADVLLAEEKPFRIFLYADLETKLARCRAHAGTDENMTEKQMIHQMKEIDRARAANHNLISDTRWGDKEGYDLCVNTSGLGIDKIIPTLVCAAKAFFGE